ncbi:MAG: hypothetical protein ABR902_15870 [Candidatus Korobacteraceae bacterium]|jgi:hypothetical protein
MEDTVSRLVAVSLESTRREPYVGSDGRLLQSAVIRGESSTKELSFTLQTGLLSAGQIERCEALRKHGFTVVEAPPDWRYSQFSEDWQGVVVQEAMRQVESIMQDSKGTDVTSGYDAELAQAILEAVNRSFPRQLDMVELKHELHPEPSDRALFTAIDALLIERLIEGPHIRSGMRGELGDVVHVRITSEGRKHLKGQEPTSTSSSGPVFHGDQINNYGQVGAIGRHSQGVLNIQERWKEIEQGTDLQALAVELERLRTEYRKVATSREDDKQVALLGDAAEEAEKGNGSRVAAILSHAGRGVLEVAKDIGTDVAAKVIVELMKVG